MYTKREMKALPKYTLLFFIFTFIFSYVHSQTSDSCASDLTLQTPLPFDTSSLRCASVWGAQSFILRYVQSAPNVWNFVLSAPNTNAYIGIGFSPNGNMVGSSAIVGWVANDGTGDMKKYFLGGKSEDLVRLEPSNQGLQIGNSSITLQSNQIYLAFQLIVDMPRTRLIYAVGPVGRLPSRPNFRLSEHRDMASTALNFVTGQFQTQNSPQASLKRSHGLLNMLGWAILMPIGVIIARYMRNWNPIWFYSHVMVQSLGFILGFIGIICGLVLENRLDISVTRHKGLGIFILVLGCLQVMAILIRPDKDSSGRKYWNWYHFCAGRLLIFFAVVNVFYGINLGNARSGWNASFAVVLVILFVISLTLELRLWLKK